MQADDNLCTESIASLHTLAVAGLKTTDGKSRFDKYICISPPGANPDALRTASVRAVEAILESQNVAQLTKNIVLRTLDFRSMVSLSGEALIKEIESLQQNTLCCVVDAHKYRFSSREVGLVKEASGSDKPLSHLTHLCSELIGLSERLEMTLVAFVKRSPLNVLSESMFPKNSNFIYVEESRRTTEPQPQWQQTIDIYQSGSWPQLVADDPLRGRYSLCEIALRLARQYASREEYDLAWKAVDSCPEEINPEDKDDIILLWAVSAEVGNHDVATQRINDLLNEDQVDLEDLGLVHEYCLRNEFGVLADAIAKRLGQRFPGHCISVEAQFRQCMRHRDFQQALEIAKDLQDPILIAYAKGFSGDRIQPEDFLELAKSEGTWESALLVCAREAIVRHDFEKAILWCRQIDEPHGLFFQAYKMRLRVLSVALHKESAIFREEFLAALTIAARRPTERHFRSAMLWLVEEALEEPSAILFLSASAMLLLHQSEKQIPASITTARTVEEYLSKQRGPTPCEKEAETALETFLESLDKDTTLGEGEFPEEVGKTLVLWMIHPICTELETYKTEDVSDQTKMLLHILVLVCKAHHHPTADFFALFGLVSAKATLGDNQTCRDLAETGLVKWTMAQPKVAEWRTALAWSVWAETAIRSGNATQALLYSAFAFASYNGPALDGECLGNMYRLVARAFRECDNYLIAYYPVELERKLIMQAGQSPSLLHRNQVLLATLKMRDILKEKSVEATLGFLAELDELLLKESEGDLYAILSLQANLLRQLSSDEIPPEVSSAFTRRLDTVPENLRKLLSGTAFPIQTTEQVRTLLRSLPHAKYGDDLRFQIAVALPCFCNAIEQAVKTGDTELFFVASGALSQPLLSVGKNEEKYLSFSALADINLSDLTEILSPTEGVLAISGEPASQLSYIYVTDSAFSIPASLPGWTSVDRARWRECYYEVLSYDFSGDIVLSPNFPSEPTLKQFMEPFQCPLQMPPNVLIVIPPSYLFGFAFQLIISNQAFLGLGALISVVPSIAWLITARRHAPVTNGSRQAWLGSVQTQDYALHLLRASTEDELRKHCFTIDRSDFPPSFSQSSIVFLGGHGATGLRQYFRSVGDSVREFTPTEIAKLVEGCGCVILAVCSGGRGDPQNSSSETLGLASKMLAYGVRTVIAPTWPVDPVLMRYWLPVFLAEFTAGKTVAEAVCSAHGAVLAYANHPLPALHLQLFGDPSHRL